MAAYDPDEEKPLDPAAERLRGRLVRLLLVSGGIMVLGFLAVFGAIVYRLADADGQEHSDYLGGRVEARIPMPAGARVVSTELDGSRALLHVEAPDGTPSLLLVDLATGAVVGRYGLTPQ